MPHHPLDTEDALERETTALLATLGWTLAHGTREWTNSTSTLGRSTPAETILTTHLRPALQRLNPTQPNAAIEHAIDELTRDRSTLSLVAANREIYHLIKEGILVTTRQPNGEEHTARIRIIDWREPANNHYLLTTQLTISGETYRRRADIVGFVNGLPLLFIELKAHHKRIEDAYRNNLRDYKTTIPHLFWYNALIILSNGSQSRIGSLTAEWEHFAAWKRIAHENERGIISLDTLIRATCTPERLLDLTENFTLFDETRRAKLIAKNHQYLGVKNALHAVRHIATNQGRLGVFWHTQGSGKSYSMVFLAQNILRTLPGNWTFLIVTDRLDLDEQIYQNFAHVGAVTEKSAHIRAQDSTHLQQLLQEDHRYLFTLIQKFRTDSGAAYPTLTKRNDIIVITDEAHRSQYDTYAQNMRSALPNAAFIGFTGTPLIQGEEQKTREIFGDYISIYNFRQSIDDNATVPLYYENRIPELQIASDTLNDDIERLLATTALDDSQERKLQHEFAREYHLITRNERLETIAHDIATHFAARDPHSKAMVIAIDKATAIRMYDKVLHHWRNHIATLQNQLPSATNDEHATLAATLATMQHTDMAVIVSPAQNEIEDLKKQHLDIEPHRKRMNNEDLATAFKNPDHPLRLVFVCAMWITGFDVPSCATIYLDKPMRNHTLMQTIARANRIFPNKINGLIVDYIGVFRNLQHALAIYGTDDSTTNDRPVRPHDAQIDELRRAIHTANDFCTARGIDLDAIAHATTPYTRIALIDDAVEAIITTDTQKHQYLELARTIDRLYHALRPHQTANTWKPTHTTHTTIAKKIQNLTPLADISTLMETIGGLLDDAIIPTEEYIIRPPTLKPLAEQPAIYSADNTIDLTAIDLTTIRQRFAAGRKHTAAEQLKNALHDKLASMIRNNKTRLTYLEQLQRLIADYNASATTIDTFFAQLIAFAATLNQEEQRTIAENLTEEELALFDILTKPDITPTHAETAHIKHVARELLTTLKREKLVLDWRKKQQARADVQVTIATHLDNLPEHYSKEDYDQTCYAVYQHIYDSYVGPGRSIYTNAA